MAVKRYAVAEIAAQEILLKVYEISQKQGMNCIDTIRRMVPVGRDTYTEGKISADVLDQICEVLKGFQQVIAEYKVQDTIVTATSAVRETKNCSMVVEQIRVRTGFHISVLSNSEQRFMRLKGAAGKSSVYRMLEKGSLLVDMGAGSLQISIFEKMVLITTQNLSLGAARISDMNSALYGDSRLVEKMLKELIDNDIHTFEKMFLKEREIKNIIVVGEFPVAYIRRKLEKEYSGVISSAEFRKFYESIIGKSAVELSRMMQIPTGYATMMTSAVMMYQALLDASGAEVICMPKADLCDGLMLDFAEKKKLLKPQHDFNEDILAASRNICKRYMGSKKHVQVLEQNVCQIFDSIKKYHGLGSRERLLLRIAAILHDCGKFISMSSPGDNSYRIIMATEILGLSHTEREIVANVARYNTLEIPSYDEFEGKLSEEQYLVVMKLAAILRIGNALDRSHKQKFAQMRIGVRESTMTITTDYTDDIMLEKSMIQTKTKFFEEVYGLHVQLRQSRK